MVDTTSVTTLGNVGVFVLALCRKSTNRTQTLDQRWCILVFMLIFHIYLPLMFHGSREFKIRGLAASYMLLPVLRWWNGGTKPRYGG